MSFYDEAVATGDCQWLDSLIKGKAHVKAHFRKDPTTGKLIYIKEHEREQHPTHVVFKQGDKVKFTEGPHAGKEFEVKGYSEDKNVLRISHPDHYNIAVAPHKVEHVEKTHENTPGEVEKPESEEDPLNEVMQEKVFEQLGFKPGDRLTTTDVLHKLPSGSVIYIHSRGKFWKKAKVVDNGDKIQIFLQNQKTGGWNTVPLDASQISSFWAGSFGDSYLSELGSGVPEPLTFDSKEGPLLAHMVEGKGRKFKLPFMYKTQEGAEGVAEGLTEKGLKAEVVAKGDHFCVKIIGEEKEAEAELKPAEQEPTPEPTAEPKEPEQEDTTLAALSPSQILNTAKTGSDAFNNLSSDQIKAKVKEWKDWFEIKDVYISNAITIDQHASFMKKLYQGEVSIGELKDAFQHFVASKDAIQKELESKTVKELSEYGFTHAKKKSEIVKQILHSMMDKYAPGGGVLWQPFSEKYEEAVQKHINRLTDDDIQNVAGKVKSKKEFHAKATTNPETIEEYKHFIRHVGEDFIDPWMEEHYQSLKKQKADQEATEQAKIPPKIETKEVGFHGHFLADKKGVKVFANHEEAKAEADKLQGHGFNAHPIGGIVKISNKGEGPPKLSDASVKKVKVGKDTWYANDNGIAQGFDSDDEALVVAHKLQSLGHNAVPSGAGIIFKDSSEAPKIDFTYHETTHTKHGHPLFVAKLTEKVDKPTYSNLLSQAKKLGGYYSSYSQGGAVPGFTFKDKAKAQQFMAEAKGEEIDVDAKSGPTAGELQNLQFKAVKGYLKLQDKASYHEDIQHEYHRIDTMPDNALQARIGKIKSNQKLYDFYIALGYKGKYQLATLAFEELKKRAGQHLKGE
jgi:transcription antitermination factor NusG/glutaredoxin-related protein